MTSLVAAPWQGGGFFPCGLIVLLVIGGLIAAGFWWSRRRQGKSGPDHGGHSGTGGTVSSSASKAEDILAERYARGEMSDEEFMQRQSVLRDHRSSN